MPLTVEQAKEQPWPKEPGWYWLYGWKNRFVYERPPEFVAVQVQKARNSHVYVAGSMILYKSEGACGHWFKAELPDVSAL